jgi:hypothetical protein
MGTQVLGKALKKNVTLRYLDISYNNIVPRSAMVLANALCHNDFLTFLNIDGNLLGSIGTATLVAAMQRSKVDNRVLRISFNNCDCKKIEKDDVEEGEEESKAKPKYDKNTDFFDQITNSTLEPKPRGRGGRGRGGDYRGGGNNYRGRGDYVNNYRGRGDFENNYRGRGDYENNYRGRGDYENNYRGRGDFGDNYRARGDFGNSYRGRGEAGADYRNRGNFHGENIEES